MNSQEGLPKLSVVIPTYNEEKYISVLLTSICNQSYKNVEVIVSDKSTDNTAAICNNFKDKLDLKVVSPAEKGVSRQRNLGAKNATSNHLVFFDADVLIENDFLLKVAEYVSKYDPKLLTGWQCPLEPRMSYLMMIYLFNIYVLLRRLITPIAVGAFLYVRKDCFDKVGGFEEDVHFVEDVSLVKRLYSKLGIKVTIIPSLKFYVSTRRMHAEGTLKFGLRMIYNALFLDVVGAKSRLLLKHDPGDTK